MSKKKTALVVALVAVAISALGLAAAVYAKYITTLTKQSTVEVAKWSFASDNQSGTITCNPGSTYNSDTLVNNKIAPGTEGKCTIIVSNENTEVGTRYSIKPSAIADKPTYLKFYSDENHQNELTVGGNAAVSDVLKPGQTGKEVYVYWYWPYETGAVTNGKAAGDDTDTAEGVAAETMTITFDITGTQVEPVKN